MPRLTLTDLSNPNDIQELFHLNRQHWIGHDSDQAFQEMPKTVELWQRVDAGIMMVQRWRKSTVLCYNGKHESI